MVWLDGGMMMGLDFDWKKSTQSIGEGNDPLSLLITPEFAAPAPDQYLAKIVLRLEYEVPNTINSESTTRSFWPKPFTPRIIQFPAVPEPFPRFLLAKLIKPRPLWRSIDPLLFVPIIDLNIDWQGQ